MLNSNADIFHPFFALCFFFLGQITALCASAVLLIQAAGRVVLHKRSACLCVAVYRQSHSAGRDVRPLRKSQLSLVEYPHLLAQTSKQREKTTWQLSQRPPVVVVTSPAV